MAAPVAHIVLALLMLNGALSNKKKPEFLAGTNFPDIRYIAGLSRKETHYSNATLEDIKQEPSSFKSGMQFHALVDRVWWDYMKNDVRKMWKENSKADIMLKFFEDTLLRDQIKDKKSLEAALNKIWDEEREFGVSDKTIEGWHDFIRLCCSPSPPDPGKIAALYVITLIQNKFIKLPSPIRNLAVAVLSKLPIPAIARARRFIDKIKDNNLLKEKILRFYNNFEFFLKEYEEKRQSTAQTPLLSIPGAIAY